MKKLILLCTILVYFSLTSYSQIIPNNSFETWVPYNNNAYEEPSPWKTTNPYTTFVGQVNVKKSDEASAGSYSARLETIEIQFGTFTFYAPGLLTFADFNVDFVSQNYSFGGGLALQKKVSELKGKYKYQPVENDSASILIYCFRHPEGEDIDTIGVGLTYLHDADDWTDFSVNMQYFNDHTPDTFNVLLLSTGTFQLGYMPPGSVLLIDDISVDTTFTSIATNSSLQAKLYPNPTSGKINIELDEKIKSGRLFLFDLVGNRVKEMEFSGNYIYTDISELSNGIYTFKITGGKQLPVTGTFVKH